MTVNEFESYLQKGLGRAILLLRQEPDKTPFREAVWNHAVYEPRYDRQCNSPRGHYIKELFDCFEDREALFSDLFRTYCEGIDSPHLQYYVGNIAELARDRVDGAKETLIYLYNLLYDRLLKEPKPEPNEYGYCIDDGLYDYLVAAHRLRDLDVNLIDGLFSDAVTLLQQSDRYDMNDFADFFGRDDDQGNPDSIFVPLIKKRPDAEDIYRAYLTLQETRKQKQKEAMDALPPRPTNWREAVEFSLAVRHGPMFPVNPVLWKSLSKEDAAEVARQVEDETDPLRRSTLMTQLRRYGKEILLHYPRDPAPLIDELKAKEDITATLPTEEREIRALSRLVAEIRHPAVRDFALHAFPKYLNNKNSILLSSSLRAWITNYRQEDEEALVSLISSIDDANLIHDVSVDASGWKDAPISLLRLLYEKTPCSSCRRTLAYNLLVNADPNCDLITELKHDCEAGTRSFTTSKEIKPIKNIIELNASELHFLGNTEDEKRYDLCLHGKATLRVNETVFADNVECCLTASALRFMRSLRQEHEVGNDEQLFPCCGNMLIPSDDGKTVTVIGCPNGIDFRIFHVGNNVILSLPSDGQVAVDYDEYKTAVIAYAKTIFDFIENSPKRIFKDDYEKKGYEAFLTECRTLL